MLSVPLREVAMNRVRLCCALATALIAAPSSASTIEDASWLVGRWVGEGNGGQVEEVWSAPANGRMVGHFQFVGGNQPDFYEILLIDVHPKGLRLRVKHFNADFTAWEDKGDWHSFEPVSASPNQLKFDGLTMARDADALTATVTIKGKDGVARNIPFTLKRVSD
jgi:hypothetical protein